ncbi:MAG: fatty acid desaturase family protein [Myxococcota bacterium]
MLRYSADWRTIFFLCVFAALSIGGWVLNPSGPLLVAWVIVTMASSWICAVIAHNTVHCPVFKNRTLNKLMQVWISLSYGFPISEYVPGHNLSHHKFAQEREDVMRTTKVNTGWNLLNFLLFFPSVAMGVTVGNYRYLAMMKKRLPAWNRQLQLELLAVWGTKVVLLLIDWRKAVLFVIIPHFFAVWGITTVNYLQHDGCDKNHPVNHSRNFVGRLFNWFTLNNGYHGIHHETPGLHWSLAPQVHREKYGPTIHPELEQKSLAVYMFKAFIYPGKRVTYDGKPVVIENEGPDHDWVAALQGNIPEDQLGAAGLGR